MAFLLLAAISKLQCLCPHCEPRGNTPSSPQEEFPPSSPLPKAMLLQREKIQAELAMRPDAEGGKASLEQGGSDVVETSAQILPKPWPARQPLAFLSQA